MITDIRNKLFKAENRTVIGRTTVLILFAIIVSFAQGFYVLKFEAKPMLENSGFLNNHKICGLYKLKPTDEDKISILGTADKQIKRQILHIKNFSSPATFTGGNLYYIWCILFSQLMMSILIGIVLQLLWEDRPITEPL